MTAADDREELTASDALLRPVRPLNAFEDTVERRVLCGEGSFDLTGLVNMLRGKGFDGPWGVEILSESFRKLPVAEALQLAANTARQVI